jgi:hypothetical protein
LKNVPNLRDEARKGGDLEAVLDEVIKIGKKTHNNLEVSASYALRSLWLPTE